jgi:hypothetical protein
MGYFRNAAGIFFISRNGSPQVVTCCSDVSIKMLLVAARMDLARALRHLGFDSLPDADTIRAAWATAMARPDAGDFLNEARDVLLRYETAWQVKQQALRDRVESVRGL